MFVDFLYVVLNISICPWIYLNPFPPSRVPRELLQVTTQMGSIVCQFPVGIGQWGRGEAGAGRTEVLGVYSFMSLLGSPQRGSCQDALC